MSEPLCLFGDGRHKLLVTPWGRSCRACHKAWSFNPAGDLIPTWPVVRDQRTRDINADPQN